MKTLRNVAIDRDNISSVHDGIKSISREGRKLLKGIAQSLVDIQNRPGIPIPDSIYKKIMQESVVDP